MEPNELRIRLRGRESALAAGTALTALRLTLRVLNHLAVRELPPGTTSLQWRLSFASTNSPLLIGLEPPPLFGQAIGLRAEDTFVNGLRVLELGPQLPDGFDLAVLDPLEELLSLLHRDLEEIEVGTMRAQACRPSLHAAANIREIQQRTPPRREWTSARGLLEEISCHGRRWRFRIWDELTGTPIDCTFDSGDEEVLERVKEALPRRVDVEGMATFRTSALPTSIQAEKFEIVEAPMDGKPLSAWPAVNVVGEGDAADFVRELRDDE